MASVNSIINKINKTYGANVGAIGIKALDIARVPTGIFPLDLSLGGGFPKGRISEIYGPESSNKTNILLSTIAKYQRDNPDELCAFIDAEHSFDANWAKTLGVDTEALVYILPSYAEQAVDIIDELLTEAPEIGLYGLDSIAGMVTAHEVENSAEKVSVGGNSISINKLAKKVVSNQAKAAYNGYYPTLICINQIRYKVGVMYGNPETTPGGMAIPFFAAMRLRCYGKNIMENAVSKHVPLYKETKTVLKKWKVPITSVNSEFSMYMLTTDTNKAGDVPAINTVLKYAQDFGFIQKGKKGWMLGDTEYSTLKEIKELISDDKDLYKTLVDEIISLSIDEKSESLGINDGS